MAMVGISLPIWRDKLHAGVAEAQAMRAMSEADLRAMTRMVEDRRRLPSTRCRRRATGNWRSPAMCCLVRGWRSSQPLLTPLDSCRSSA